MIPVTFLPQPDCFSKGGMTPEARKSTLSSIIRGWELDIAANPWQDQINPHLKDRDQLRNVMEVFNGRVKAITEFCDNRIKRMNERLTDQVDAFFKSFTKICAHLNQHGNIREVEAEGSQLISQIKEVEVETQAIVLASEARVNLIQKDWETRMECLEQNLFKRPAQYDQGDALCQAHGIHQETIKQMHEVQYRVRSYFADFYVMKTENTAWQYPEARVQEINFINNKLLNVTTVVTRVAFFEKNEEATPFLIFLMAYWYVSGGLRQQVLPWFFNCDLRQEIQRLRRDIPSDDRSIQRLQEEKVLADFRKFSSWRDSLKDNPYVEKLLKLSDKMLRDKDFVSTFVDCWHASVDFPRQNPSESYEAYQANKREEIEKAKTSSAFLKPESQEDYELLLRLSMGLILN